MNTQYVWVVSEIAQYSHRNIIAVYADHHSAAAFARGQFYHVQNEVAETELANPGDLIAMRFSGQSLHFEGSSGRIFRQEIEVRRFPLRQSLPAGG